jgi:hypothetical protein
MAWSWRSENDRGMGVRSMGLAGVGAADTIAVGMGMDVLFALAGPKNGMGLVGSFCVETSLA